MASLTKLVNRISPTLRASLENAVGEAIKRKSVAVENAHWLFHIVFGSDTELQGFLEDQGVNLSDLQGELEKAMPLGSGDGGKQPTISGSVTKLIEQAWLQASVEMDLGQITPEVYLLASQLPNMLGSRTEPLASLKPMSTDALRDFCAKRGAAVPRAASGGAAAPASDGTALQKFTINLTQQARDGELDTVLGRTAEVSKAIDVLLRKRQNNPILLGAPGVGKTAVVEGLAQKIASGEVPEQLQGADLVALDMGLLQAGASVKGEFEERLKNVIKEVQASETSIIVFIDEAHTMIGAGGAEGQNDAANLLKPALARGEFRTVGATTFAEYKKYFEKDPALSRRFQPITIEEPGRDAAVNILRAVAEGLSKYHGVFVREEAIKAAVDLSMRFMPSRRLPDKAISLMDTACARVALSQHARPAQIEGLEEELRFAEAEVAKSLADARMFGEPDFDPTELNSSIKVLEATVADRISIWEDQKETAARRLEAAHAMMGPEGDNTSSFMPEADDAESNTEILVHPWVTEATIAEIVADWTGVPVSSLGASEAERLLALEDTLKERVIGQDAAIEAIARSLKISRAGLTDVRKPIGVFMMCGPSGVGKTETALAIADQFFGGEDSVVTINMTEFKEAHKVSMLLGAAAGYVGYGKGGVLTEAVRRRPYCVLLLDEMEKAHREIQDIFFQIFDKGHISDSEGNDVDFRNTIIIMTSNAGGEEIRDFIDASDGDPSAIELADHLRPLLLDWFSPAFIGRTELIAYKPLTPEVGSKLTEIHLNRIKKRIHAQYGSAFFWDQSFVDYVVSANSDPLSGGRALEAIINKKFLPSLAEGCIARVIEGRPLSTIKVSHDGEGVAISME